MNGLRGWAALEDGGVRGHVFDPQDLTRRFVVELLVDGLRAGLARADAFAAELPGVGDGCFGFGFRLPRSVLDGAEGVAEVRLANTGERVGAALPLPMEPQSSPSTRGRVAWTGGLRLAGTLPAHSGPEVGLRAFVEGREVARADCTAWHYEDRGTLRTVVPAFDLLLPPQFADGGVHRVTVVDDEGVELAGSPCALLAFPDALRAMASRAAEGEAEEARAALLDRLIPRSVGFDALAIWAERHGPGPSGVVAASRVSVVLVGHDFDASLPGLEAQQGVDWTAAHVPESGGVGCFDSVALDRFLADEPEAGVVVLGLAGTRLRDAALAHLAAALAAAPEAPLVYADAALREGDRAWPLLWPAYDPERQLEQGYGALLFAAPPPAVRTALGRGAASLPSLFLDLAGRDDDRPPVHLPHIVADLPPIAAEALGRTLARAARRFLDRDGVAGEVRPSAGALMPAVRVSRVPAAATLSVAVIATPGREPGPQDLEAVRSRVGDVAREFVVASHRPVPQARGWRSLTVPGVSNPSRLRNAAADAATGDLILFLDAGTLPRDADWYAEMAGRLAVARVSAVGALLLGPEGIVLDAGTVLGVDFAAAPAFAGLRQEDPGYLDGLRVARHCGALGPDAVMMRRGDLLAAGGFDDVAFPDHYGSIDLSLRLRAGGGRLVATPHVGFVRDRPPASRDGAAGDAERRRLRDRWGADLIDDPCYHPALNLDRAPFTGLAWPPRAARPRRPERPRPHSSPPGF